MGSPNPARPSYEDLLGQIDELRDALGQYKAFYDVVKRPPFVYGEVLNINQQNGTADVLLGDGKSIQEVFYDADVLSDLQPRQAVRLNPETHAIVDIRGRISGGIVTTVHDVLEDGRPVIKEEGKTYVLTGTGVKPGDKVVVNRGYNFVVENLGRTKTGYELKKVPDVSWGQIGGLDDVIEELRDVFEYPLTNPEPYRRHGRRPARAVLLKGPPGCGKTLLAQALANSLKGYFLKVDGPEFKNLWYGESERGIRDFFAAGRDSSETNGGITVGFIDEAEALVKRRGRSGGTIDDSLLAQMLSKLNGFDDNDKFILLLATNRADLMDSAFTRPGRVDRVIHVGRPNKTGIEQIYRIHLRNAIPHSETDIDHLVEIGVDELFNPRYNLFRVGFRDPDSESDAPVDHEFISLGSFVSGAMIENIVQLAIDNAIRSEREGGDIGVTNAGVMMAVDRQFVNMKGLFTPKYLLHNTEELMDVFPDRYHLICQVTPAKPGKLKQDDDFQGDNDSGFGIDDE